METIFWLYLWGFPALWFGLTAIVTADPMTRQHVLFGALEGLLWPLAVPPGIWVAFNPKKAERIRLKYGTAAASRESCDG